MFGNRTQDRIDLKALIEPSRTQTRDASPGERPERRAASREVTAERSRHLGRMFQYVFLLAAVGAAAVALAGAVASALKTPVNAIERTWSLIRPKSVEFGRQAA